jgi:C4-dicarboxylate transporter DctM subunit
VSGWVIAFFMVAALLGMPLAFALGIAAVGGLALSEVDFNTPPRMMNAISLSAHVDPLFMVAGELMIRAGSWSS